MRTPSPKEIRSVCKDTFSKSQEFCLVALFGSYATGKQKANSDIDIIVWLHPNSDWTRQQVWEFWDNRNQSNPWSHKASLIVKKWKSKITLETILFDLPEEHIPLYDPFHVFSKLKKAILNWRKKYQSERLVSEFGKPYWKYTSKNLKLKDIDFSLELPNVA